MRKQRQAGRDVRMFCVFQAARNLFLHGRPYRCSYLVPRRIRHTEIKCRPSEKNRHQNQKEKRGGSEVTLLVIILSHLMSDMYVLLHVLR